jgi:hypothetical protein
MHIENGSELNKRRHESFRFTAFSRNDGWNCRRCFAIFPTQQCYSYTILTGEGKAGITIMIRALQATSGLKTNLRNEPDRFVDWRSVIEK